MITISLSDKMAQRLWRKLQYKQNEVWIYLRNKLLQSTGFPQVIRQIKEVHARKVLVVYFGVENRWKHCWWVLRTGQFGLPADVIDEAMNKIQKETK